MAMARNLLTAGEQPYGQIPAQSILEEPDVAGEVVEHLLADTL